MSTHVLTVLEHDAHGVRSASRGLLAAAARVARELGGSSAAVVTGAPTPDAVLNSAPVDTIYAAFAGEVASLARAIDLTVAAAEAAGSGVVVIAETTRGREIAGGVAARLRAAILTSAHALSVENGRVVVQAAKLGGSVVTSCAALAGRRVVILVRPNAMHDEEPERTPRVEQIAPPPRTREVVIEEELSQSNAAVSLDEAEVVVSGGRGLGGPEAFTGMLADLAAVCGGAVGASRAVVDAGWAPHAQQVGQTGKTIRPRLYFAIAISGAIQHRVGMQTAGTIVAINKDADVPIAEIADLLVVGDANAVVPELTRQLRRQKGLS